MAGQHRPTTDLGNDLDAADDEVLEVTRGPVVVLLSCDRNSGIRCDPVDHRTERIILDAVPGRRPGSTAVRQPRRAAGRAELRRAAPASWLSLIAALASLTALSSLGLDLAASADPEPDVEQIGGAAAPPAEVGDAASPPPAHAGGAKDSGAAPGAITASVYRVRPGDVLSSIAVLHGVPMTELAAHNDLHEPFALSPAQFLRIPVPSAGASPPTVPGTAEAEAVRASIERWSAAYFLPPDLLAAVLWQESRWRAEALSPKGAVGVGQLLPSTAAWLADDLIGEPLDPWVIDDNVRMASHLLRWLIDRAEGDQAAALASYYQGWGSTDADGWYGETEGYVADVFVWRWRFRVDAPRI